MEKFSTVLYANIYMDWWLVSTNRAAPPYQCIKVCNQHEIFKESLKSGSKQDLKIL